MLGRILRVIKRSARAPARNRQRCTSSCCSGDSSVRQHLCTAAALTWHLHRARLLHQSARASDCTAGAAAMAAAAVAEIASLRCRIILPAPRSWLGHSHEIQMGRRDSRPKTALPVARLQLHDGRPVGASPSVCRSCVVYRHRNLEPMKLTCAPARMRERRACCSRLFVACTAGLNKALDVSPVCRLQQLQQQQPLLSSSDQRATVLMINILWQ